MYARLIPKWRELGFSGQLIYSRLPDSKMAVARVAERIAQGGHCCGRARDSIVAFTRAGATLRNNISFSSMRGHCMMVLNVNRFSSRRV